MVRVLVLAPFQYVYGNKSIWMTVGESMYLNALEDREELKYLLSAYSEYRYWLYVEESEVTKKLQEELKEELEGSPLPDNVGGNEVSTLEKKEIDFTAPAEEPKESIFLKPEVNSLISSKKEEQTSEKKEEKPEATPLNPPKKYKKVTPQEK